MSRVKCLAADLVKVVTQHELARAASRASRLDTLVAAVWQWKSDVKEGGRGGGREGRGGEGGEGGRRGGGRGEGREGEGVWGMTYRQPCVPSQSTPDLPLISECKQ